MSSPRIPFVDLQLLHRQLAEPIQAAIARVVDSSGFILGEDVDQFEREFAAYVGTSHAIGVSSGTDAIHLSLRALGIGPGDEVILPAMTFLATATAVVMCGATPVLADIEPDTYHLDPDSVRSVLSDRTRAILPVHLYGQLLNIEPLLELAQTHGLELIEDACQAHGTRAVDGRLAGHFGRLGCFSFYPSKNLGALGDAGAITTDDDELAEKLRWLRHHGQRNKNDHPIVGFTNRIDAVHAAVLRAKLPHLDDWNQQRRTAAAALDKGLAELPVTCPAAQRDHNYHLYVIRAPDRDALADHLASHGVASGVHYPSAIHEQPSHANLVRRAESLVESERAAREVLSLPMYPGITSEQIDHVVAAVRSFFG